ncbi:MAG TPA: sodium:solute symporter [Longimicrobiales bacterium]|nr:sodium:solute symporter [Longimicrobiales bacterium]
MTGIDWAVFVLYFGGVVSLALWQSRKNVGVEGYFLANRRLPWLAVGLSVMATQASAITFIGTTGQAYDDGMEFIQVYLGLPVAMVILCILFVPFFYKAKLFTAYEYLEKRFDPKTRSLTAFLFLLSRGMGAGIILYAPAIVLSVILGWDEVVTIAIMAVVTILYTTIGGITAVIWTDVIQMLMMFGGILLAVIFLFVALPSGVGVGDVVYVGGIQRMWASIDLSWDPSNTYTIWSGLVGGLFLALAYFGTDQSQVQRYLTARSLKESRLSLIFNAFLKVPMQFAILSIGVLLFVFYHFQQPPLIFNTAEVRLVQESERAAEYQTLETAFADAHEERRQSTLALLEARERDEDVSALQAEIAGYDETLADVRAQAKDLVSDVRGATSNDVNYVFPTYIIEYFPAGIVGLMISVIFAAAMSSLDSELTALSSATVVDFYRRWFRPEGTEAHYLLVSRLATLLWGLFAFGVALYAGQLGSLIEAVNQVGSFFYGSLLGVFLLAFLVDGADGRGAFSGLLAGMGAVAAVAFTTDVSWLWYNVVGALTVLAVGTLLSGGGRAGGIGAGATPPPG